MSRRTRPLLGWLAVAVACIGIAAAGKAQATEAEALSDQERQVAETIYANQCATCHGSDGQGRTIPGTKAEAPPLTGESGMTVPYLDLTLRVGRMPPPDQEPFDNRHRDVVVGDDEREALVAYLADQFDIPGEVPDPPEGTPAAGREIYAANCAQCHGFTGAGGVAGAGAWVPPLVGYDPVVIAEAIRVGPFEMPRFAEEQISDQEIGDVAAFVELVSDEHGTPLGLVELNPVFASGFAFVFAVVILFSAMWIAGRPTWFADPDSTAADETSDEEPSP